MQCKLYIRNNKTIKLRARSKPMPLSLHMLKTLKETLYMQTQGIIKRPYQALYSILFFPKTWHWRQQSNAYKLKSTMQMCNRNTDVDVNDTQFTVTCHFLWRAEPTRSNPVERNVLHTDFLLRWMSVVSVTEWHTTGALMECPLCPPWLWPLEARLLY